MRAKPSLGLMCRMFENSGDAGEHRQEPGAGAGEVDAQEMFSALAVEGSGVETDGCLAFEHRLKRVGVHS